MKASIYAPVIIFVYNRINELKLMIDSLKRNHLASDTEVFIFSDGPKNDADKRRVDEVRCYIDTLPLKGYFKKVTIRKADSNKGLANSVISGVSEIIDKYDRVIVVEDDLILSEQFLSYMNKCLDHYRSNRKIWSISGYTPELDIVHKCDKNVYLSYRASSYGWGTWKDRWIMNDWSVKDYGVFLFNPIANLKLSRGGNDMPRMLRCQMRGLIDSWAIRWCYSQSKHDMLTVYPKNSFVRINGFNGNGTHSQIKDKEKYRNDVLASDEVNWCYDDLELDPDIVKGWKQFYNMRRIELIISEIGYWKRKILKLN